MLRPPRRAPNGYRRYDESDVQRLQFIRAAQAPGFTLREIAGVLTVRDTGEAPCEHVQALIEHHLRQIDDRIRDLERARDELGHLADRAQGIGPEDCPPSSICRIIPDIDSAGRA